jgi:excisionase family DNA binding protein
LLYSVDEVSDRLGIPRPTLYRYLREYSIPHLRRAGKISIPEESFELIREARELHREGLGTESVRRRLQEEDGLDVEGLVERLDRLSGALERLREELKPVNGRTDSQSEALQTLHKKQDALFSEVSRLHGMVQELSRAERGFPREPFQREASSDPEVSREPEVLSEQPDQRAESPPRAVWATEDDPTYPTFDTVAHRSEAEPTTGIAAYEDPDPTTRMNGHEPPIEAYSKSGEPFVVYTRRTKFGALAGGRWRWVLALLAALSGLLVVTVLVWGLLAPGKEAEEQTNLDESEAQEEHQSSSEAGESLQAVEVPGLIGLALPEAEEVIDEVGLEQGTVNEKPSYAIPAGTVAAQEPAVGVEVDRGVPVNLMVSSGSPETAETASNDIGGTGTAYYHPLAASSQPL